MLNSIVICILEPIPHIKAIINFKFGSLHHDMATAQDMASSDPGQVLGSRCLLICSSTCTATSLLLVHRPAESPIWLHLSSMQAMLARRLERERSILSSPCTLPFSASCWGAVRPVALASFSTLVLAMTSRSISVSVDVSLKRPATMPMMAPKWSRRRLTPPCPPSPLLSFRLPCPLSPCTLPAALPPSCPLPL